MIPYSECLGRLKREISQIRAKVKKLKPHQKQMIKFIHSEISQVEFDVKGKTIILRKGDDKKGFRHILQEHYNPNDLETIDILNLPILFRNAVKLNTKGVSNNNLTVYYNIGKQKEHKLVTNELGEDKLIVTSYRKS